MSRPPSDVALRAGAVYRTAWLRRWGANPTRMAQRLAARGVVRRLEHGLLVATPGAADCEVRPSDDALLTAFLDGAPYVITGPSRWNALGLGFTAPSSRYTLVYNTKRTGRFTLDNRLFELRRVAFPAEASPEWFVVDLLRAARDAGDDVAPVLVALMARLQEGKFHGEQLLQAAEQFGRRPEIAAIRRVVEAASAQAQGVRKDVSDNIQPGAGGRVTITAAIQQRLRDRGPGWVFTPADLDDLAARPAIDQALSRLARREVIRRLARGIYDVPRTHPKLGPLWPAADAVARAVASSVDGRLLPTGASAANALGLSTQVPARADYLTDGRLRRVRIGKLEIRLRRASRLDLLLPDTRAGAVLSALGHLGRQGLSDEVLARLRVLLDDQDKRQLFAARRKVPAWMGAAIERVADGLTP